MRVPEVLERHTRKNETRKPIEHRDCHSRSRRNVAYTSVHLAANTSWLEYISMCGTVSEPNKWLAEKESRKKYGRFGVVST